MKKQEQFQLAASLKENQELSQEEIGDIVAKAAGRDKPYAASTISAWLSHETWEKYARFSRERASKYNRTSKAKDEQTKAKVSEWQGRFSKAVGHRGDLGCCHPSDHCIHMGHNKTHNERLIEFIETNFVHKDQLRKVLEEVDELDIRFGWGNRWIEAADILRTRLGLEQEGEDE